MPVTKVRMPVDAPREENRTREGTYPLPVGNTPERQRLDSAGQQSIPRGYFGVFVVLMVLALLTVTLMLFSARVRNELTMSFVRQPDRYTELYFSTARPIQISPGQADADVQLDKIVSVFFTVVNHEGRTTTFPYAVQVTNSAGAVIGSAEGSVEVPDEGKSAVWATVNIPESEQWSRVDVGLLGRIEHISFLPES